MTRLLLIAALLLGPNANAGSVPDIPVAHFWERPPDLVICAHAPGGYGRWRRAKAFTERKGAQWGEMSYSTCDDVTAQNTVYVGAPVPGMMDAGLTITLGADMATRAFVMVQPRVVGTWTPEHELFHAQGLDHHTMTNHVLNRSLQMGGWRSDGIRSALRRAWGE